jgi:hypothetical protein
MQNHQDAVMRLIEVPGIGAEAAPEIIAGMGPGTPPLWDILHQGEVCV